MKKILDQAHLTPAWCSYAGGIFSVLNSAGIWKDEFWKLYGLSGMAFQFIVHEECCPSSVTVYDWVNGHYHAMDRLGVFTSCDELFYSKQLQTFSLLQQHCTDKIKQSIDQGKAVLVWAPTPVLEFGIIKGYDDDNRLLFAEAVNDQNPDPLMYDNLGMSEVPIIYCQYVLDHLAMDTHKAITNSLQFGLSEWRKENHIHPQYACGRKAYDFLLQSMDSQKLNGFGLGYILAVYQESKQVLHQFLDWIHTSTKEYPGIEEAALLFRQVAENFHKMHELWPFNPGARQQEPPSQPLRQEMKELIQSSKDREQRAMKVIEKSLNIES
ncbi:hypothetical protein LLG10_08295 [bacterium]|nr:hypothetical protein [bacterium]